MKIKTIILTLSLIITMISNYNSTMNEIENVNTAFEDESIAEENVITTEVTKQQEENVIEDDEIEQENEVVQEEIIQKHQEISKPLPVQLENKADKSENVIQNVQEIEIEPEQELELEQNTEIIETQKEETQVTEPKTQSDLEYWCVAGGSHHIAGDGANEHGYYASWAEANQAFENYTNGWASVEYKISQCPCGLFYFWAIQSN